MTDKKIVVNVVDYGRKNLYMRYVDPDTGQQVARTTKTSVVKEAQKLAGAWEKDLNSGKGGRVKRSSWEAFRERYEDETVAGMARKTEKKVSTTLDRLEEFFADPATNTPELLGPRSITTSVISGFQAWLRKQEGINSESTIQSYMAHLRSMLVAAEDRSLIHSVPKFPKLPRAKKITSDTPLKGRPLTDEEFVLYKAQAPTPAYAFFVEGLWLSGLRLAESLEFYWEPTPDKMYIIMGDRPLLSVAAEGEKGHRDRLLPTTPDFAAFLHDIPKARRKGRVFDPQGNGKPSDNPVSLALSKMGRDAGIVVNSRSKYASAHDLRRSFGERWAMRVMPNVLMQLMRHRDITTTMRYYVGRNATKVSDLLWEQFGNGVVTPEGNMR